MCLWLHINGPQDKYMAGPKGSCSDTIQSHVKKIKNIINHQKVYMTDSFK